MCSGPSRSLGGGKRAVARAGVAKGGGSGLSRAGMQVVYLERDAFNDMERVNNIAQGLGHLAAMGVAHHGVQVHLLEGHLPCNPPPKSHTPLPLFYLLLTVS